jgi:hypothetical protein
MVFLKQLNEGVIKRKIRKVPTKNRTFDSGKEILWELINTNKDDRMKQDLELFPFKSEPRKP